MQQQQKDCLEEVSRREKAIQKLEIELLKAQETVRLAQDDVRWRSNISVVTWCLLCLKSVQIGHFLEICVEKVSRKDDSSRMLDVELKAAKEKLREAVEEVCVFCVCCYGAVS